jgi:hypothetical protein
MTETENFKTNSELLPPQRAADCFCCPEKNKTNKTFSDLFGFTAAIKHKNIGEMAGVTSHLAEDISSLREILEIHSLRWVMVYKLNNQNNESQKFQDSNIYSSE